MKYVLVTTSHRGVFVGYLSDDQDETSKTLVLTQCRNIIYWAGKRGFLGLAASGPDGDSRLGDTAPRIMLHDITSVTDCTDEAKLALIGWIND